MIRLTEHKEPQHDFETVRYFDPAKLYLPLSQHTGSPCEAVVKIKGEIEESDLIAKPTAFISSSIHSPKKGVVASIEECGHPVLKRAEAIVINCKQEQREYSQREEIGAVSKAGLIETIKDAGIVGLGGAAFPTHVKLAPPKRVDTLIINGCECEPYLACDYRLMVENPQEIFKGVEIVSKIIEPKQVFFCIEDNKPQAIKNFNLCINTKSFAIPEPKLFILKTSYPQGAEKQLIYSVTKRKVPAGGLPFDVGCLVSNVGTYFSIYEAVYFGKPLIERIVTFAGGALKESKNVWVKIGTNIKELFDKNILQFASEPKRIVFGGPMMGVALDSLDYPVIKGTSGILFLTENELDLRGESNCIRCGRCVDRCPSMLLPLEYVKLVKKEFCNDLEEFYIADCIECGICSYVCPAKIPIVQYIKLGKERLKSIKVKK